MSAIVQDKNEEEEEKPEPDFDTCISIIQRKFKELQANVEYFRNTNENKTKSIDNITNMYNAEVDECSSRLNLIIVLSVISGLLFLIHIARTVI